MLCMLHHMGMCKKKRNEKLTRKRNREWNWVAAIAACTVEKRISNCVYERANQRVFSIFQSWKKVSRLPWCEKKRGSEKRWEDREMEEHAAIFPNTHVSYTNIVRLAKCKTHSSIYVEDKLKHLYLMFRMYRSASRLFLLSVAFLDRVHTFEEKEKNYCRPFVFPFSTTCRHTHLLRISCRISIFFHFNPFVHIRRAVLSSFMLVFWIVCPPLACRTESKSQFDNNQRQLNLKQTETKQQQQRREKNGRREAKKAKISQCNRQRRQRTTTTTMMTTTATTATTINMCWSSAVTTQKPKVITIDIQWYLGIHENLFTMKHYMHRATKEANDRARESEWIVHKTNLHTDRETHNNT